MHATNPSRASESINNFPILSESEGNIQHMYQCWSSPHMYVPCQRNPVQWNAGNKVFYATVALCFLHWQGHYSSCQCGPTSPPPWLLVMESGGASRDVAVRWPSGKCSPLWMTDAWECEGDSTGSMSLNVTRVSHPPTLTLSFLFFSHHFSLPHCVWIYPPPPPPLSFPCPWQTRDLKKVGVTIVGPQKKIVSSLKALDSHTKNGPVPV